MPLLQFNVPESFEEAFRTYFVEEGYQNVSFCGRQILYSLFLNRPGAAFDRMRADHRTELTRLGMLKPENLQQESSGDIVSE
jgi:hypothetical protein